MKQIFCLVIALLFVFSVAPAIAADLQTFPKMTDQELSSVRGGANNWNVMIIVGQSENPQYYASGTGNFFASKIKISNRGTSAKQSTEPRVWRIWNPSLP